MTKPNSRTGGPTQRNTHRTTARLLKLTTIFAGVMTMTETALAQDIANDSHLDPQVRAFLTEVKRIPARSGNCRSPSRRKC